MAANLPKLERLDLSGNPLGDEGLGHLAAAASLRSLRELILRSDDVDSDFTIRADGAAALARSDFFRRLRALILAGQNVGDAGIVDLVGSPNLEGLELLDVSRNGIGAAGSEWAEAIVTSPNLGRLRDLNLSLATIDAVAAKMLAGWPHLATGCVLRLRGCNWSRRARDAFERSEYRGQFDIEEGDVP